MAEEWVRWSQRFASDVGVEWDCKKLTRASPAFLAENIAGRWSANSPACENGKHENSTARHCWRAGAGSLTFVEAVA